MARTAPVRDADLNGQAETTAARELMDDIVATPTAGTAGSTGTAATSATGAAGEWRGRRGLLAGRGRRLLAGSVAVAGLGTAAAVAVTVVAPRDVGPVHVGPQQAQAAVHITKQDGHYVARVTDPMASKERLSAAFAEHNLDIELQLVPGSPSTVGTIVAMTGGGDISMIRDEDCVTASGGDCAVGLRIPADYAGHAEVTIARAARPGEDYATAGQVTAPGEALHGVDLRGLTLDQLRAELASATLEPLPDLGTSGCIRSM